MGRKTHFGRNSCPTMDSSTELFPELWLPITTMLGSFNESLWSMLRSILLISISFLVRCIRPFWRASNPSLVPEEESDGADMVAATSAAMAASSSGDRFRFLPCCSPLEEESLLSPPVSSALLKRPLINCGVSGSLTSGSWDWTDLSLSDAVPITSDAASFIVDIQSLSPNSPFAELFPPRRRSLINCGVSGSLTSGSWAWADLNLSDAVSIASDAASFTVDIHPVV